MKNIMFHVIIPSEKNRIAEPETLLRSFGNWDHKQFKIGIELKAKQLIGTNRKKKARVKRLSWMLRTSGEIQKSNAQHLMTNLYPRYLENLAAISTNIDVGKITQSNRKEFVLEFISLPVFLR